MLRLVHLSDPHFSHFSFHPLQFFSKRWLGNFNVFLFRRRAYDTTHLWKLFPLFEKLKIDAVMITGDLSSTALPKEFESSLEFVKEIKNKYPVYIIPGNHDYYVKKAETEKHFYRFFNTPNTYFSLKEHRIEYRMIKDGWWWIGLDTAIATSFISSNGFFFPQLKKYLEEIIEKIPKDAKIILANHFPLFSTKRPRHDLINNCELQKFLQHSGIKIYLHGHDHHPYIINRVSEGFPLCINAGSCSLIGDAFFNFLECEENQCKISSYKYEKQEWIQKNHLDFFLK